jgi:hypothetical protein
VQKDISQKQVKNREEKNKNMQKCRAISKQEKPSKARAEA